MADHFAHTPRTAEMLRQTVQRGVLDALGTHMVPVVIEKCIEEQAFCDFVLSANSVAQHTAIRESVARLKPGYLFACFLAVYHIASTERSVGTQRQQTVVVRAWFDRKGALSTCRNIGMVGVCSVLLLLCFQLYWWLNYDMRAGM